MTLFHTAIKFSFNFKKEKKREKCETLVAYYNTLIYIMKYILRIYTKNETFIFLVSEDSIISAYCT